MADQQPLVTKRALDALAVAPEVFLSTAKDILSHATGGTIGEIPFLLGHEKEELRQMGTIYVIPKSKRRSAFPVLWDTERNKYRYPALFQALDGPSWANAFNSVADNNGTIHLDDSLLSESGDEVSDLPNLIDDYLDERMKFKDHIDDPQEDPADGTMLLFRPAFAAVDRCVSVIIKDDMDESVTTFLRGLYGFHPSTDLPTSMVTEATEGTPRGYGIPEIRTASVGSYRYVSAISVKDAKKLTRFYTTYQTACTYAKDSSWPVYRFKVDDETGPDWASIKEVRSEAEDVATRSKFASRDAEWLEHVASVETMKMVTNLYTTLARIK